MSARAAWTNPDARKQPIADACDCWNESVRIERSTAMERLEVLKQLSWIGCLLLALPLISCKETERETTVASKRIRGADVPTTKAHSWCEAKISDAKLKLPSGFVMTECSNWSVNFSRPEYGLGPRSFGKPQAPSTSINIWFLNRWPAGMLERTTLEFQDQSSSEGKSITANANKIPDVAGLKNSINKPIGWYVHEGADKFKYYYYTDDEAVFCEGFIRQSLLCGVRGGKYFMTWLYSGRDIEANLTEMLDFRKANIKKF